jgi:hypothetical protein
MDIVEFLQKHYFKPNLSLKESENRAKHLEEFTKSVIMFNHVAKWSGSTMKNSFEEQKTSFPMLAKAHGREDLDHHDFRQSIIDISKKNIFLYLIELNEQENCFDWMFFQASSDYGPQSDKTFDKIVNHIEDILKELNNTSGIDKVTKTLDIDKKFF